MKILLLKKNDNRKTCTTLDAPCFRMLNAFMSLLNWRKHEAQKKIKILGNSTIIYLKVNNENVMQPRHNMSMTVKEIFSSSVRYQG